jgi:N-acyl-phosphatidylethanolamine-hydrolysing phospholipase D
VVAGVAHIFFAGDTGYAPFFHDVRQRFGPVDLALLPIGAYEPRWFMRPVHMNPEEAVQAFQDLQRSRPPSPGRPAVMVGMHWGTFKLTDEPMGEPPLRARRAWQAAGLDLAHLWLPAHGASRVL